jgi:hypothetical protein
VTDRASSSVATKRVATKRAPIKRVAKKTASGGVFQGRLLTGTDWFEHYYTGERVALLATGAEAAEILPELLHTAASVTVFEESPTWVTPIGLPTGMLRHVASRAYLRLAVRDRWTRRQLTPHKRYDSMHVQVSPSYYSALQDPRTRLLHWPTYAIVEKGVRAVDGVEYRFDTIVVGATSKFVGSNTVQTPKDSSS